MIQVTEKYFIQVDNRQYIVFAKSTVQSGKNQGEIVWIDSTYHGTMTEALTNVLRRMQRDKLSDDRIIPLKEAIKELKTVQDEFTKLTQNLENYGGK